MVLSEKRFDGQFGAPRVPRSVADGVPRGGESSTQDGGCPCQLFRDIPLLHLSTASHRRTREQRERHDAFSGQRYRVPGRPHLIMTVVPESG